MPDIFISYRREDSEDSARALYESLTPRFGKERVFMDVDSIDLGTDFRKVLERRLSTSGIFLVIIGPQWLSIKDPNDDSGRRRLDDPTDYVRQEIAAGLKKGDDLPVIPVLVRNASLPRADQLPEDLKDLAFRNALVLSHLDWEGNVQRLVNFIQLRLDSPTGAQERRGERAAPQVSVGASTTQSEKPVRMILGVVVAVLLVWAIVMYEQQSQQATTVEVPELVGKPLDAARQALENRQLAVGNVSRELKDGVPRDTVIGEIPNAGEKVKTGSSVALTVSDVPNPQTCQILSSTSNWTLPGTAEVFIDDNNVGVFRFGHTGSTSLSFPCTPGQHIFRFRINMDGKSTDCSGNVRLDRGAQFNPGILRRNGVTTCTLVEQ